MRHIVLSAMLSMIALNAADLPVAHESMEETSRAAAMKSWKLSLAPLVASQALDASSSYGMRELNPLLASSNGGFEMKATSIKIGATAAAVGIEYLLVRKYPHSARILSKMNWATGIVTTSFAIHNYAIK